MHPLRISGAAALGRKRQGRLYTCGGPSRSKGSHAVAAAIASEPSPDALTHSTVHWTNRLTRMQDTRMAIAPYGDRRCSSHLSHHVRSMYEDKHCTASPSPQFACPQRDRKRLSREATLHAVLALEWPELVQIGRCKVQWLPSGVKKRMLTSFSPRRQSTQHYLPLGVVSTPKRSHTTTVSSTGLSRSIIFCSSSG